MRVPLWLKIAYTLFVCVHVPYYWLQQGPLNLLYFCDVALMITLPAIWRENRLLISMAALAILIPQLAWIGDLLTRLLLGRQLTGMTGYMFDPRNPVFFRALSLFHAWLPILLIGLLHRLGYDRRALLAQTVLGISLLMVSYIFIPPPPAPANCPGTTVNVNYVYGLDDHAPQHWMPGWMWLMILVIGFPVLVYWPTHWVLARYFAPARMKCQETVAAG